MATGLVDAVAATAAEATSAAAAAAAEHAGAGADATWTKGSRAAARYVRRTHAHQDAVFRGRRRHVAAVHEPSTARHGCRAVQRGRVFLHPRGQRQLVPGMPGGRNAIGVAMQAQACRSLIKIYTFTHLHMITYKHAHTCTQTHIHTYRHAYIRRYADTHPHMHASIYASLCLHMHACLVLQKWTAQAGTEVFSPS